MSLPKTPGEFHRRFLGQAAIALHNPENASILDAQLEGLMKTFRADLGGLLLRRDVVDLNEGSQQQDPEKYPFQLFKLIDKNGIGMQEGIHQGAVYSSEDETPPYLHYLWKIRSNAFAIPTENVGVDAWLPIWTKESGTRGAFFIDDTSRSLDEAYDFKVDLEFMSIYFSALWEKMLQEVRLKQELRSRFRAIDGGQSASG